MFRNLNCLTTTPDPFFDHIAQLAASICGTQTAFVSFSDHNSAWIKAGVGVFKAGLPKPDGFLCALRRQRRRVHILDAEQSQNDELARLIYTVNGARYCVVQPLIWPDGDVIGALCVLDPIPRAALPARDADALARLAECATEHLKEQELLALVGCRPRRSDTDYSAPVETWRDASAPVAAAPLSDLDDEAVLQAEQGEQAEEAAPARTDTARLADARFRALFDSSHQVCVVLDQDGAVLELNDTAVRYADVRREDCVGLPVWRTPIWGLAPDPPSRAVSALASARRGESFRYEVSLPHDDGSISVLDFRVKPVAVEGGDVSCIILEGRDITEERRARIALEESEQRYRYLYTRTPVMMHSVDSRGNILNVSDAWLEKLGYAREEVVGRNSALFFEPVSLQRIHDIAIPRLIQTGACGDFDCQVITKSGKKLDILLSAFGESDERGRINHVSTVLVDVTERKEVERRLVQAQKMESVGQLTGGLAHDFNNLLNVILGNLELLKKITPDEEEIDKRLSGAKAAVMRGAELTTRLLAFSRRQKLEASVIGVNPLIRALGEIIERTLGENIEVCFDLADELPKVEVDASQLESAIMNLALNARDAMPDGGVLTISSKCICEQTDYSGYEGGCDGHVEIAVTDTGTGIAPEIINQVFEPFFTTKDVGQGSGLGLSMVYGFIHQSGGRVEIDSKPNAGASIRLLLPACAEDVVAAPQTEAKPPSIDYGHGGECVLIVEDQDEVRDVAIALVQSIGYRTLSAPGAEEALRILERTPDIDLVFTDIVMPGMNGVELARRARAMRPDLPIVYATGFTKAEVLKREDIRSERDLVVKPYGRDAIAEMFAKKLVSYGADDRVRRAS